MRVSYGRWWVAVKVLSPHPSPVGCRNALLSYFGLGGLEWEILGVDGRIRGDMGGLVFLGRKLAKQKFQELVALLAETEFGPDGPSRDTDFATIERFGHRAGQMLGRTIDKHLTARHAQHFQEASCPTCGAATCEAVGESDAVEEMKTRPLQTQDGTIPLAEPAFHCPTCDRTFFPSADCGALPARQRRGDLVSSPAMDRGMLARSCSGGYRATAR